jgi:hypothetical protein
MHVNFYKHISRLTSIVRSRTQATDITLVLVFLYLLYVKLIFYVCLPFSSCALKLYLN